MSSYCSSLHEIKPYPFAMNLNKNYPCCVWWKKACRKEHVLPLLNSPPCGKITLTMPNIVTTAFKCFSDLLWLLQISKHNAFVFAPFLPTRYIIPLFLLLLKWFWLLIFFPWKIAMMLYLTVWNLRSARKLHRSILAYVNVVYTGLKLRRIPR